MSRYDDIWHDHVSGADLVDVYDRTGYTQPEQEQAHLELYMGVVNDLGRENFSQGEIYSLWGDYLDAFGPGGAGEMSRADWFENMGIDPADFDWDAWREAMGY